MIEKQLVSLRQYNTFGIDVVAGCFIELYDESDYEEFVDRQKRVPQEIFILGGGSNVVFIKDITLQSNGCIVHPVNDAIRVIERNEDSSLVEAEAGTVWDCFVDYCIDNELYGVENLAGIPGTVGASPVQNIGAYGMEAKDIIERVHVFDLNDGSKRWIENSDCHFSYRHSVFKEYDHTRYIIDKVVFRLRNTFVPDLRYKALADNWNYRLQTTFDVSDDLKIQQKELARMMSETVRRVRDSKLPNPRETGSAGSFFKNPVVHSATMERIKQEYPDVVSFPTTEEDMYKLSAGWLIEKCGWKGRDDGTVGVYKKQALVLVNRGGCTGSDVVRLAKKIIRDVDNRFGIVLEPEAIILDGVHRLSIL